MTFLMSKDGDISGTLLSARNIFLRLVKQAKMKSYHQSPKYKFGYRIPKDYEEALKLDELNQNDRNRTVDSGEYVTLWLKHVAL
jgi:hypothetical protein